MPAPRKNQAQWNDATKRWQISIQRNGKRTFFYSSVKGTKGKIAAEKKADAFLQRGATDGTIRIEALWDEWLTHREKLFGENAASSQQHRKNGKNYILPKIGKKKASSITLRDWQGIIDDAYIEKNLAKKTLENIRGSMTVFWKYCHSANIDLVRPEALTIPRNAEVGERTILQPSDLQVLFSEDTITHYNKLVPSHYIHAWRFQVLTGFRPGEVVGLQWSDVSGSVVTIRRAVNVDDEITKGKNDNARRTVVIPDLAVQELKAQKAMIAALGVKSPWVFPQTDGAVSRERTIYKTWLTFRKQHNITAASLYELRHTMVSVSASVPDALLKQAVGHSKNMDTRGVYGHRVDGQMEQTAVAVNAAFETVLKNEQTASR